MPRGYGYGNARLRAMRSRLLTGRAYDALLDKATIEELINALAETPYREDVEAALVHTEGVRAVFEAVRANLTCTLRQIRRFYEARPLILVDLLFRRWDRHNLLAILRGQRQNAPPEQVLLTVVPVGQLDEVSLRELARQPGLRAVIDLMTTWRLPYARVLRRAQSHADVSSGLDHLELALNHFHYRSLWEALPPGNGDQAILLTYLQTEVDLTNIATTLRLARMPGVTTLVGQRYNSGDVRPLLLESKGYLSVDRLANLVSEGNGVEGVVVGLSQTRYGPALQAGWQRYQAGEGGLSVIERELERWQAGQTAAMFRRNPLSIAIPIGFIGCKEVEVANLRLITQAVALNRPRQQVRRNLIALEE